MVVDYISFMVIFLINDYFKIRIIFLVFYDYYLLVYDSDPSKIFCGPILGLDGLYFYGVQVNILEKPFAGSEYSCR